MRAPTIIAGWGSSGDSGNVEGFYVDGGGLHIGTSMEDETGFVQLAVRPVVAQGGVVDLSGTFTPAGPRRRRVSTNAFVVISPFTMFRASPTHVERLVCSYLSGCNSAALARRGRRR